MTVGMDPQLEIEMVKAVGTIVGLFISGVGIILWYLLRQKDANQQKDIESLRTELKTATDALWEAHRLDAEKLSTLQREIDREHYVKSELDGRFTELKQSISDGLHELGSKLDSFGETVISALVEFKK